MTDLVRTALAQLLRQGLKSSKAEKRSDKAVAASAVADVLDTPEAHQLAAFLHGRAAKAYESQ